MTQEIDIAAMRKAESMLAECRDAMPTPAPGDKREVDWAAAMACASEVPGYVKASIAALLDRLEQAEKDAARLDWMQKKLRYATCDYSGPDTGGKWVKKEWRTLPNLSVPIGGSLRDYISAAMQGEGA